MYISIAELFLNSQAIHFTKAFGYTHSQMHVELNILGRRKYEMQLANRGKYTFLKGTMRIRKYYANPKLLLATTWLLEYTQYVQRRI